MAKRRTTKTQQSTEVLEQGNIYFFYRPKVNEEGVHGLEDVQRFYMVLHPEGRDMYRLIVVGKKRLPDVQDEGDQGRPLWAYVERTAQDPRGIRSELLPEDYQTETRGERHELSARPAGEGVYAIVRTDRASHLVYGLELPEHPDEVQRTFKIEAEASYAVSVKNPDAANPSQAGLPPEQQAKYPTELREMFRDNRFIPLNPPDFLDFEGAEILLIGATTDISGELGIALPTQKETEASSDILKDMKLNRDKFPLKPLFEGKWK